MDEDSPTESFVGKIHIPMERGCVYVVKVMGLSFRRRSCGVISLFYLWRRARSSDKYNLQIPPQVPDCNDPVLGAFF